jgi:hypothetical protein
MKKRKITEFTNFMSTILYPTIIPVYIINKNTAEKYFNWIERRYPSSF